MSSTKYKVAIINLLKAVLFYHTGLLFFWCYSDTFQEQILDFQLRSIKKTGIEKSDDK